MNASLPAVLLVLLLSGTWLLGRRRSRPFLRSTDTSAVVALNRAQIERLREPSPSGDAAPLAAETPEDAVAPMAASDTALLIAGIPREPRQRRVRLRQLSAWLAGSREQRLRAISIAAQYGDRCVLPVLHRGLRDPDPAVMAAAAAGMERFRGRAAAIVEPIQPWRGRPQAGRAAASLPLTVSRTR